MLTDDRPRTRSLSEGAARLAHCARSSVRLLDQQHRLTPELAEAIAEAGFARYFVPRRWGGTTGRFGPLAAAVAEVAEVCPATAWCASLYAAHGRLAAYLPHRAQQELWGGSPDVRIAAAVSPPEAEAVPYGSGWRISGRWTLVSGADFADWMLLALPGAPARSPEQRFVAVPGGDCRVLDTWRSLGLRGTGSNTVELDAVPVPGHRSFTVADLGIGRPGAARCHSVPHQLVSSLQFAAPITGAARGALRDWQAVLGAKRGADGRPAAAAPSAQRTLAQASAAVHAAQLLVGHAADRADRGVRPGQGALPLEAAENIRDLAMAADLCARAVDQLFRSAGARCQTEGHPLQRRWRDVTAASGHAALDLDTAAAVYAVAAARGQAAEEAR
ncbi:acyl-CoA dehydrogenase family protein [Peterkaempfera griseoplana]|uniref:acyl-CoA dehydrogenase family protein n=1 Tax=Peterkaempfera griseoplana TaxID=66896 RepID=UPI0006E35233|nr:acyl-CoA dehydrogenase family protein [Peterkaempfera griseoplana]